MILTYLKKYYIYIIIFIVSVIAVLYTQLGKPEETVTFDPNIHINEQDTKTSYIYIDIKGSVLNPGVYKVEEGTRLFQVLYLAGGMIGDADEGAINLSLLLSDEDVIYIPAIDDEFPVLGMDPIDDPSDDYSLIDINSATLGALETLPGIGPVTAQAIIDYRTENGAFGQIEDLMSVPGIGEGTYGEIKDLITT